MTSNWRQSFVKQATVHATPRPVSVVGLTSGALSVFALLAASWIGPAPSMLLAAVGLGASLYALASLRGKGTRDQIATIGFVVGLIMSLVTIAPLLLLIVVLNGM